MSLLQTFLPLAHTVQDDQNSASHVVSGETVNKGDQTMHENVLLTQQTKNLTDRLMSIFRQQEYH